MDVAVRELKAKLSAYLQRAAAGELITVTDRRRPVAVLGPPIGTVDLDAATCELAATIAEQTGVRTIDALHLGVARRLGTAMTFLTFDARQAQAARALGFTVAGA